MLTSSEAFTVKTFKGSHLLQASSLGSFKGNLFFSASMKQNSKTYDGPRIMSHSFLR